MTNSPATDFDWLALTKLAPPAPRPDLIARTRLFDALQQALLRCSLTLISAPAGSGKTTLLVDWLSERQKARAENQHENIGADENMPITRSDLLSFNVAWVSLDEDDNDPARFFTAISIGLQRSGLSSLSPPNGGAPEHLRLWLTRLINALLASGGPSYVLILDDLHWISDPAIFAALDQLIERIPPQLRLIAATRHDPPLALARLRVRRQLAELHLSDLRFTIDETARWLNIALQLDVPAEQIASLVERTEGWAAGISLLANSLERMRTPADRAVFFEHLHHTDRTIFEFLAEEVLNRQDPFVRMFLLETAVLPNLTPVLCQAVTGRSDAEALLDALYRRNLFLMEIGVRAVAHDALASALGVDEEGQQGALGFFDLLVETEVGRAIHVAQRPLPFAQCAHPVGDRKCGVGGVPRVDAQRSTVGRKLVDVEDGEAVAGEQLLGRPQREVRVVLVIDRVELVALDQPLEMRELDGDDAIVGKQRRHSGDEGIEIGDLRKDILAREQVGLNAVGPQLLGELLVEELGQRVDALCLRDLGNVASRFDAEHGYTRFDEPLQHVAVVGRDFDDETVGPETETFLHVVRIAAHMFDP